MILMLSNISSKQPKVGNTNTPVRNIREVETSTFNTNEEGLANFTIRRKQSDYLSSNSPLSDMEAKQETLISAIGERVLKVIKTELPKIITSILQTELAPIKSDLQEFRDSLNFLSEKYDDMKKTIETKEKISLKTTVSDLSDRLNNLDQYLLENNVEIHGVPEHHNENLPNHLQQCGKVVSYPLSEDDMVKCTRVAKLNKDSKLPRSTVVKFRNVRKRDEFYSAVHRFNKSNPKDRLVKYVGDCRRKETGLRI
ncbi:unnamed protein product [Arctia plantaginis]|uniref:Uncharacterized protein n=1 Tax=Arctia plantaginis TaxID=874455 RepID=A0A8S0ZQ52_ARCPL|nr:unnamed protein product [Arctia plantaginis]